MSLTFRYRAATASGELVEGVLEADDQRAATEELRRRTLVPVSVEGHRVPSAAGSARWSSRADDVATALRTLAALVGSGATLDASLAFATRHAIHPEVQRALDEVRRDVQGGQSLAAALRERTGVFGTLAPAMVRAGEESGTLDATLERLADHLERSRELRNQVRAALLYPALLGVAAVSGVLVLLTVVVPRFVNMLATTGGTLPASTRLLVGLSTVVTRGWWAWLALGVLGMGALVAAGRDPALRRRWHAWRLQLPVVGDVEQQAWLSRWARALGVLLDSGTPMLRALRVAQEGVDNLEVSARLEAGTGRVERGEPLSNALGGILPPLASQLLAVGEESGTLGAMAMRLAETADREVQRRLRTLAGLVEPLLIVVFGGLVAFVALAMLQAIYAINANVL